MIQRIQTLYLFLVSALAAALCFVPVGGVWLPGRVGYYALQWQGAVFHGAQAPLLDGASANILFHTVWLTVLPVMICLIGLITLFIYKKRILQVRLCVINAVLSVGYYGMYFWYMWVLKAHVTELCGSNDGMLFMWGLALPLICAILISMAARAVLKDEAMVRSLDRIR